MKKFYDRGGSVVVPQAPEEPDERIDKMTGLPYDLQAGGAFVDEEDRLGFVSGGLRTLIQRLGRGIDDVVEDTRPTTRFNVDDETRGTLRDFRYREPENFVDPNDPNYSTTRVSKDNEGRDIGYQQPDQRYFNSRKKAEDKLTRELDNEFNTVPQDDTNLVQRYVDDIPRVSDKPPAPSTLTKEEFLKDSKETSSQFNGRFFSETRYDNPLSARIPRELGMHIGTKGQAETILMRGTHPTAENMIERVAIRHYMDKGMTESQAEVAIVKEGIPDDVMDFIVKELNDSVPIGVEPSLQQGFINVKNPLVLDTDMINWNPAKFLGGSDPEGKLKLKEQADTFIEALRTQSVKLPVEEGTRIVDDAARQIDAIIRKKDKNSGKLLNSAYDHNINIITRRMLEDLGFDSIKYKNMGELSRVSERQAGGNSYILFREDQFVTDFTKQTIPVKPFESVPRPATYDEMFNALDVRKKEKINIEIPDGQKVGLRLDIPAYTRYDTWVPTIHDEGGTKLTSHRATAAISDVDLSMSDSLQRKAEKIKGGKAKSPFARIGGRLINRTDEENYRLAQEYLDDPEWTQVGYNPDRHSYFFDRSSPSRPVVAGEEALQVGPLVLVKNAKFGNQADFRYAIGGKVLGSLGRTRKAEGGPPHRAYFKPVKDLLTDNKDKEFVKRILNPALNDTLKRDRGVANNETHRMAAEVDDKTGNWYVYPTVVNKGGTLTKPKNPMQAALDSGEYISFGKDKDQAVWLAADNYKTQEFKDHHK